VTFVGNRFFVVTTLYLFANSFFRASSISLRFALASAYMAARYEGR
jgi:hypothetical protein